VQRIAGGNVNVAPQGLPQIEPQIDQVEQAAPTLELHEEVHISVGSRIAPGNGAEDASVDDAMLAHWRLDLPAKNFK
jgi:hypothetical protein